MAGFPFDVAAEAGFLRRGDGAVVKDGAQRLAQIVAIDRVSHGQGRLQK